MLCGGKSRRMGRPKAWLPCGDEYLLQRMARIVSAVVQPVVVAAHRGQTLPPLPDELLTAHDAVENCGPLAGMAAGFDALAGRCEAAFVISCDHPLLKTSFIARLIELLDDHPAVVPRHKDRLHPLAAVYQLQTRSILADQLTQTSLRVQDFAVRCEARIVLDSELRVADPTLDSLRNLNDSETYERTIRALTD